MKISLFDLYVLIEKLGPVHRLYDLAHFGFKAGLDKLQERSPWQKSVSNWRPDGGLKVRHRVEREWDLTHLVCPNLIVLVRIDDEVALVLISTLFRRWSLDCKSLPLPF